MQMLPASLSVIVEGREMYYINVVVICIRTLGAITGRPGDGIIVCRV